MITDKQLAYRALFDFGARWSVARSAIARARRRRHRPSRMLAALTAAGASIASFRRWRH